mgnify:CR=1 FL=1
MRRMAGLWAALLLVLALTPVQAGAVELPIQAEAALLMEKETGQVLYAQNEHEALEPASVTKVMTLLLTMEAIEKGSLHYDDVVTVSAYATSMGGSHVYLSEGEQITVDDLLKAVCVASGNDAAVALAECVAGVTELFVEQMNTRAKELGMTDTHFVNCTGLPAEGHVTSAWDIALMSRELILNHPDIRNYTTIWMDSIRNGAFGLPYLGGCRLFLLLAGSVEYQFALRFGRTLGRLHRLQVGAGFIQLLGRNDALFIEVVHAVEGFLGQQQSCLGFFPEIQCGFLLLDTGTGEGFLVHGRCGALHGFGLLQLGIQFGGRERVEQFALGDVLSLLYFHLLDTAGNFRRSFVCSTFHRSLDVQGRGLA